MPAEPPADSEAATEVMSSLLRASTVRVSLTLTLPATLAVVVLSMRPTSVPAPTPPRPPKATAPATPSRVVSSEARTVRSCVAVPSSAGLMVAPLPMAAVVVSVVGDRGRAGHADAAAARAAGGDGLDLHASWR